MPVNHDTSFVDNLPQNVAVLFWDRVTESQDHEAFRYPRGEAWESVTWKQTGDRVRSLAAGLLSLGLESEQRVGIAASTRYDWILADLAIMCAGGATTTVYPTTNAPDTAYILGDSECRVVFAEDDEQLAKLKEHRSELPHAGEGRHFRRHRRRRLGDHHGCPRRSRRQVPRPSTRRSSRPPRTRSLPTSSPP